METKLFIDDIKELTPPLSHPLDEAQIKFEMEQTSLYEGSIVYGQPREFMASVPFEMMRRVFMDTIRYVPFDRFLELLKESALEFKRRYHPQPYVIVIRKMNPCKSNFWVAKLLLSQTVLRTYPPVDIVSNALDTKDTKGKLLLFPDDGMFSGQQMHALVSRTKHSHSHSDDAVVLVAVTTRIALEKVAKAGANVIYGELVPTMADTIRLLGPEYTQAYASILKNGYERDYLDKAVLYFDHKLPDEFSVARGLSRFISGCRQDDMTNETKQRQKRGNWKSPHSKRCPVPPYVLSRECLASS